MEFCDTFGPSPIFGNISDKIAPHIMVKLVTSINECVKYAFLFKAVKHPTILNERTCFLPELCVI